MRSAITLFTLLFFLALAIALSHAAERAIDAYSAAQTRPYTAVDTVMESRRTPPAAGAGSATAAWGAGVLATGLVVLGGAIALLLSGGRFLRQLRLLRRRPRRRSGPPAGYPPTGQPPYAQPPTLHPPADAQLPPPPRAPGARRVPDGEWYQDGHS